MVAARWIVVGSMLVLACGPQVALPEQTESTGGSEGDEGASVTVTTSTSTTSTGTSSTSTGPVTTTSATTATTTDPDTGTSTSTSTGGSSEDEGCVGECLGDEDCPGGGVCIACVCFGECAEPAEGVYGDCVQSDGSTDPRACMSDAALCLVDNAELPTFGVCTPQCTESCECPPAPAPFAAQVVCEDLTGDDVGECFIACGGNEPCPPEMVCHLETLCLFSA